MEIEFKYGIDSPDTAEKIFTDPDVISIADENSEESMELHAIYFDTLDRRLSREGITFRTRREGSRYVATIKWNGVSEKGLHEREEINIPIDDEMQFKTPDVDLFSSSPMCQTIKDIIGEREFMPTVEVVALRRQVRIDTGNSVCEISYDQGKVINEGKEAPISEMEIELYSGSREEMEEFCNKLAEKYGLLPENRSKFKQGLDLDR